MTEFTWDDSDYFRSGEWQVVEERLNDYKGKKLFNPPKRDLFLALDLCPYDKTRVVIVGQDPYPTLGHATGVAFSLPKKVEAKDYPPTFKNILKEYSSDLHYPEPSSGDLTKWAKQGILLWNAIPSVELGKPLSHDWEEWKPLTAEILRRTSKKGCIMVLLGGVARSYREHIDEESCIIFETSHPSPRGNLSSKAPFLGSRIFTKINAALRRQYQEPIDWELP